MRLRNLAAGCALLGFVISCSEPEEILAGERYDARAPIDETMSKLSAAEVEAYRESQRERGFFERLGDTLANSITNPFRDEEPPERNIPQDNRVLPIALPAPKDYAEWTHANGNPRHSLANPDLQYDIRRAWAAAIGAGNSKKHRITATPIVADGRIFTIDSQSELVATSPGGRRLWSLSLVPAGEQSIEASGGGMAYGSGTLLVTSGYGNLHAINPADGRLLWTQSLGAAPYAAPTVSGGIAYAVTQDAEAWAIDINDGRLLWNTLSTSSPASLSGGASPAVAGRFAVIPFPGGELAGFDLRTGARVWSAGVAGSQPFEARTAFAGITGDPVIDGNVVYAGSLTGATVALNLADGTEIWRSSHGSYNPVWTDGGALFLVSDRALLVRLDSRTGERVWSVPLPDFKDPGARDRAEVFAHFGPVLAGDRLIIASSDGRIRSFDPRSGRLMRSDAIPSGATTAPIVVNGTMYVVSAEGVLHAYR